MLVSLFSDASWCPHNHVGGWGAWARSERGVAKDFGPFNGVVPDSNIAEVYAVVNGLHMALDYGIAEHADRLLIQTDSQVAILYLSGPLARQKSEAARRGWQAFHRLVEQHALSWVFRHVPGHTSGKQPRLYVNKLVDQAARTGLQAARDAKQ